MPRSQLLVNKAKYNIVPFQDRFKILNGVPFSVCKIQNSWGLSNGNHQCTNDRLVMIHTIRKDGISGIIVAIIRKTGEKSEVVYQANYRNKTELPADLAELSEHVSPSVDFVSFFYGPKNYHIDVAIIIPRMHSKVIVGLIGDASGLSKVATLPEIINTINGAMKEYAYESWSVHHSLMSAAPVAAQAG